MDRAFGVTCYWQLSAHIPPESAGVDNQLPHLVLSLVICRYQAHHKTMLTQLPGMLTASTLVPCCTEKLKSLPAYA